LDELDDIFQDFLDDFERRNSHKLTEKIYEQQRELYKVFKDADPPLEPGKTVWQDVIKRFNRPVYPCFQKLDDLDRFQVFEDFMNDRMHDIREERKKADKRMARKHREAFINFLERNKEAICENPGMKWSEFLDRFSVKGSVEYIDLIGTKHSSQPYDLFAEMRSKWKHSSADNSRVGSPHEVDIIDNSGNASIE
jgi:hypothetical protein